MVIMVMLMATIAVLNKRINIRETTAVSIESTWRWDDKSSRWQQWDTESEAWVFNHKPLPQWYIDAEGSIPTSMFLRLWKSSNDWSELHQNIFWLSLIELQDIAEQVALECRKYGVEPPENLPVREIVSIPSMDVVELMNEGVVTPIEGREVSITPENCGYDPMQALFEAQKNKTNQVDGPRPFFQAVEQGKFTAKH